MFEGLSEVHDLGSDHSFSWVVRRPRNWPEDKGWSFEKDGKFPEDMCGIFLQHLTPEGKPCEGYADLKPPFDGTSGACWKAPSLDPLTMHPSLECSICGDHGWIVDGIWKPA